MRDLRPVIPVSERRDSLAPLGVPADTTEVIYLDFSVQMGSNISHCGDRTAPMPRAMGRLALA
jgi:hypothetical protein